MQDSAQFVQLAQTLCYDLARAKKATDGKKIVLVVFALFGLFGFVFDGTAYSTVYRSITSFLFCGYLLPDGRAWYCRGTSKCAGCQYSNMLCFHMYKSRTNSEYTLLFLSLFRAGWCLLMLPEALAQTSMFEREWQIHVSYRQIAIQQLLYQ